MGVNAAGVEVILRLTNRIDQLEGQVELLRNELDRLADGGSAEGETQTVEGTVQES